MLRKAFARLYSGANHSHNKDGLVTNRDIDAALESLSVHMRSISHDMRWRAKLREPMAGTLEHLTSLTHQLQTPEVELSPQTYYQDPRFGPLFSNSSRIPQIVNQASTTQDFFKAVKDAPACYGVMWTRLQSSTKLACDLSGDNIRREVMRTQHGFSDHNITHHSVDINGTRAGLRAHLLDALLSGISDGVETDYQVYRRKGDVVVTGDQEQFFQETMRPLGQSYAPPHHELYALEDGVSLNEDQQELLQKAFAPHSRRARETPHILSEVRGSLEQAASRMSLREVLLKVDAMGFELEGEEAAKAKPIQFHRVDTANGSLGVPVIVSIPKAIVDMEQSYTLDLEALEKIY